MTKHFQMKRLDYCRHETKILRSPMGKENVLGEWATAAVEEGVSARLAAKVAAHTCAQRINESLNRPLRHLVDLLV
jgi:hypothetical protein